MMLRRNDRNLENIPVGALGLIALDGCTEMGAKVNDYLVKWRKEDGHVHKNDVAFTGYEKDTYLIDAKVPRFGSGAKYGLSVSTKILSNGTKLIASVAFLEFLKVIGPAKEI